MEENNNSTSKSILPLGTLGLITFIVFLVLKLSNEGNPSFDWLSWFWVWFPLWAPVALGVAITLLLFVIVLIVSASRKNN